jgi:hypothetical protein
VNIGQKQRVNQENRGLRVSVAIKELEKEKITLEIWNAKLQEKVQRMKEKCKL